MTACPGCNQRVSPGDEECSYCGTPLLSSPSPVRSGSGSRKTHIEGGDLRASAPVSSARKSPRKTHIDGSGTAGAGGGRKTGLEGGGSGSGRKTHIEGGAPVAAGGRGGTAQVAPGQDLYVPRGRSSQGESSKQPLDRNDPFARAVVPGGRSGTASVQKSAVPSARKPAPARSKKPAAPLGRRKKKPKETEFWTEDPDSKATLIGDAPKPWENARQESAGPDLAGLLISFSLDATGVVHPLRRGRTRIGRAGDPDLQIELDDGKISTPHCEIVVRPSGVFLTDAMSTNGTWHRRGELTDFEDIQVAQNNSVKLEDGDCIRLGNSIFLVRLLDPGLVRRIWGA